MNLIITGPQASGKGTQAVLLEKRLGMFRLSMGEIFRQMASEKSDLGGKIDEYINKKGVLVPEWISLKVAEKYLSAKNLKKGIIFDGYPRTKKQLEVLIEVLKKKNSEIDVVFYVKVSNEEVLRRLSGRLVCSKCGENFNVLTNYPRKSGICDICEGKLVRRQDETTNGIKKRLEWYHNEVEPLLKLYQRMGILEEVDGEKPIEVIFEDVLARLKNLGLIK